MNEWKLIWREIGWVNINNVSTIRNGWALECINDSENTNTYVWIEDNYLAVCDPMDYYPSGCYNIPLDLLDKLHNHHWEK